MNAKLTERWRTLSKLQRVLLVTVGVLLVLSVATVVILAHYWPFGEKGIGETLEETVPGTKVTIARFHSTFFLHPGCWAEGVTLVRQASPEGTPPLVTVQKLVVQANYHDLVFRPGYISRVVVDGLHIQVPQRGSRAVDNTSSAGHTKTTVGEIVSSGALLEIGRRNNTPLKFEIHDVRLHSVGAGNIMPYSIDLKNPLPPGEVQSTGRLGPWNPDLEQVPLSGEYKFERANLGAFPGLAGTLSSTGRFEGKLGELAVTGDTDLPDFMVRGEGHAVRLATRFEVLVNGTNGDVRLDRVNASLQQTPLLVTGSILGRSGSHGKTTSLDLSSTAGRVQDILRPFVEAPSPPMLGPMNFRAHVTFGSEPPPFFKRVRLAGDFAIDRGRFGNKERQNSVDDLSEQARGIKPKNGRSETVDSILRGHVALSGGAAKFSEVVMDVPGAEAQMTGTFNILNERIDFHGTLKTDVKLSQTQHGIKAALLKPLDPFFKRRSGGASIPVEMTGTYSQPHFGMEVVKH